MRMDLLILSIFSVGLLGACSPVVMSTTADENIQADNNSISTFNSNTVEDLDAKVPPIDISISQEFVREGYLYVKARLIPKTELTTKDIVIQLTGLSEGEVVEVQTKKLNDILSIPSIHRDEAMTVEFKMANLALSEYQIQCSWGAEARSLIARLEPNAPVEKASNTATPSEPGSSADKALNNGPALEDIAFNGFPTECSDPPCDITYTITGVIINNSDKKLANLKIALGMVWVDEGSNAVHRPNFVALFSDEQVVDLDNINIIRQSSKKLNLTYDSPVAVLPGGSFMPTIRILSYQLE